MIDFHILMQSQIMYVRIYIPQVSFPEQSNHVLILCVFSVVLQLQLNLYHNHLIVKLSPIKDINYDITSKCNTFTPQIKGICCGLNVMYHIPQLPRCVTTSLVCYNFHWNVLQLPIGMHKIMLQLPMACYKNTRVL